MGKGGGDEKFNVESTQGGIKTPCGKSVFKGGK
jgi:hypothetical protein